jgi:hypothetical protein
VNKATSQEGTKIPCVVLYEFCKNFDFITTFQIVCYCTGFGHVDNRHPL